MSLGGAQKSLANLSRFGRTRKLKLMKHLLVLLTLLIFLGTISSRVFAADLDIVCDATSCSPSTVSSFFPAETWYPGKTMVKTLKIANKSSSNQPFGVDVINIITTGTIDQIMSLSIKQVSLDTVVWSGTLSEFYNAGELILAYLPAESSDDFSFTVTLDSSSTNQNQSTSFDLLLGFISPTITPPTTPTSTSTPEPTVSASSIPTDTPVPQPSATSAPGPTSTPGPAPTSTPVPAVPTAFVFGGPFTSIVAPIEYLPDDLLGTQSAAPTGPPGEILGAGEQPGQIVRNCQNNWWILVLLLEAISTATVVRFARKDRTSRFLFIQSLSTTICLFVLAQFFCLWWSILLTGCLGILGIILIYLKDFTPLG